MFLCEVQLGNICKCGYDFRSVATSLDPKYNSVMYTGSIGPCSAHLMKLFPVEWRVIDGVEMCFGMINSGCGSTSNEYIM